MTDDFDLEKVTSPLLLHLIGRELPMPRLFLWRCKLTVGRLEKRIDSRFPPELVDLVALPIWVYLQLVMCGIDNAANNSYLADHVVFHRGGPGHRISDGAKECRFVWERTDRQAR